MWNKRRISKSKWVIKLRSHRMKVNPRSQELSKLNKSSKFSLILLKISSRVQPCTMVILGKHFPFTISYSKDRIWLAKIRWWMSLQSMTIWSEQWVLCSTPAKEWEIRYHVFFKLGKNIHSSKEPIRLGIFSHSHRYPVIKSITIRQIRSILNKSPLISSKIWCWPVQSIRVIWRTQGINSDKHLAAKVWQSIMIKISPRTTLKIMMIWMD